MADQRHVHCEQRAKQALQAFDILQQNWNQLLHPKQEILIRDLDGTYESCFAKLQMAINFIHETTSYYSIPVLQLLAVITSLSNCKSQQSAFMILLRN